MECEIFGGWQDYSHTIPILSARKAPQYFVYRIFIAGYHNDKKTRPSKGRNHQRLLGDLSPYFHMKLNPSLRPSYSSKESKIWTKCSGYETFYFEQNYSTESTKSLAMMCIFVKP